MAVHCCMITQPMCCVGPLPWNKQSKLQVPIQIYATGHFLIVAGPNVSKIPIDNQFGMKSKLLFTRKNAKLWIIKGNTVLLLGLDIPLHGNAIQLFKIPAIFQKAS